MDSNVLWSLLQELLRTGSGFFSNLHMRSYESYKVPLKGLEVAFGLI